MKRFYSVYYKNQLQFILNTYNTFSIWCVRLYGDDPRALVICMPTKQNNHDLTHVLHH